MTTLPVTDVEPPAASSTTATMRLHRAIWARKPVLRRVYGRFFRGLLDRCSPHRPIVELGCGPGFLKRCCPDVIATDIEPTPWIDRVADATDLPFDDASVGNVVAIDVFHHLPKPMMFLGEAARVLKPGGRVVLLEPWTSLAGAAFYRHVHHESADATVDPLDPFGDAKDPMDGNVALPRLYFGPNGASASSAPRAKGDPAVNARVTADNRECGATPSAPPRPAVAPAARPSGLRAAIQPPEVLRLLEVKPFASLSWLLSGGFRDFALLPALLVPLADAADRLVHPLAPLLALRAWITIERTENRTH